MISPQAQADPTAQAEFPAQYAATARFTTGAPRTVTVRDDGGSVFFLRSQSSRDSILCLWVLDAATGETRLLVDPAADTATTGSDPAAELARRERVRESASGIVAYSVDRAGEHATFVLGGRLHVVDVRSGAIRILPTTGDVFDPVIDPTGQLVAYASEGDASGLWVVDIGGNEPATLLVGDHDPLVSWGKAEFVAAEEMGRTRGFWWSPDGNHLLVARVAEHEVPVWWIGDPAHPERRPKAIRYPAAGSANANVRLAVFSVDGPQPSVRIDWADQGRFEYLAGATWPGGSDPLVVRQTRDQKTVEIVELAGLLDGDLQPVVRRTITDDVWVELVPGSPTLSPAGLLTVEGQGKARRLMLEGRALTDDTIQVRSLVGVSDDRAICRVSFDDPTQIHVLAVPLDGTTPERLSDEPGLHQLQLEGSTAVTTSTGDTPGQTVVVTSPQGRFSIDDLSEAPVVRAAPRYLTVGERDLRVALFTPTDHDGSALPVLLDPYGGPHAQRVLRNHNGHAVSQWFANEGYAVIVVDGRGTPGRGPAFERAVWGDLAAPVLEDQLIALDAVAELTGFLDLERVGIRGWSFGGYLAALAAIRRPDRIHAAIAGAPVTDWRLYDTHYTERYLGHPDAHPDHYRRCDLTVEADRLGCPLLFVHGLADDNVVAAHTLQLSTALLGAGRPHQVLPLAGVSHMTPQQAVAENLLRMQASFLAEHLQPSQSGARG